MKTLKEKAAQLDAAITTNPRRYRHQYGQRWNAATPRDTITLIVGRIHVATSDEAVAAMIRVRCENARLKDPRFTDAIIEESVRFALLVHARNRDLYRRVTAGRLA